MNSRIEFALEWIDSIKTKILEVYYNLDGYDLKSNDSEVTDADRDTEQDFRKRVADLFPKDGIIGEEFSDENSEGDEYTWTIDPIDGTRAFVHGVPFFGTMVGLYKNDEIQFGAVAYHSLDEIIYAEQGQGTFWKSSLTREFRKVSVSKVVKIDEAVLSISGEEYFKMSGQEKLLDNLKEKVRFTRTWGDCYGYCLLARGKIDVMIDPLLHKWDVVPLKIIIEEAGGTFLNIDGTPSTIESKSAFCSNGLIDLKQQ